MKFDVKHMWVEALLSGKYEQGRNVLRTVENTYCCLGVLCELAVQNNVIPEPVLAYGVYEYQGNDIDLPDAVAEWAGLDLDNDGTYEMISDWVNRNDNGVSFDEIAKLIDNEEIGQPLKKWKK